MDKLKRTAEHGLKCRCPDLKVICSSTIYTHKSRKTNAVFRKKYKKLEEGDNLYFLQTLDFVASALTVISGFVAAGYIIAKGARIIYEEIRR